MPDWEEAAAAAADDARRAAATAGGPSAELLGAFLPELARACDTGRRLDAAALAGFRALGARAADEAVPLRALIDLYLSAAWRAWRQLPAVGQDDPEAIRAAGEVVLHAIDDAVAAIADGHETARRTALLLEESNRREFVDDLLEGTGDPAALLSRAERYGLDLTGTHAVAVIRGAAPVSDTSPLLSQTASALTAMAATDFLITTRHRRMIAILPTPGLVTALPRGAGDRVGVGRSHRGVASVALSYRDALDALDLAERLGLTDPVVHAEHLLVYRVLTRDREAMRDLIDAVLTPLETARGGAGPLLDTLDAYFATGGNTTATAARLHLSVRAITYRLHRIRDLTGHDPAAPADRFVLQTALLGARALGPGPS
ncbi:PucR family transcriptional regulator [Actinoplanes subtropicus]|uniref:PucR family transcriptional regulator n=1 Tax=Actinoplanes subtropicus TaxID=543632 RepID=UPI0004C2EA2F|nr:helix-turn-helix domain-containing protein [Actinoplanes subtropicus]